MLLEFDPPFDWTAMLRYLAPRATPGVELVDGTRYLRAAALHGHRGHFSVAIAPGADELVVELSPSLTGVLSPLRTRLRRMFDLDAEPQTIAAHLCRDPVLRPLVRRRPGLRLPGAIDGFEIALRAVLGQQVTVRGASTLAGRLAALVGRPLDDPPPGLSVLPVSPDRLADAPAAVLAEVGLTRARAACLVSLGRSVADGSFPELSAHTAPAEPTEFIRRFTELPGIGPWTAAYVAMRGLGWADAFPESDLGLRKATGGLSPARLRLLADTWRPWRSYAAQHLWAGLADPDHLSPGSSDDPR